MALETVLLALLGVVAVGLVIDAGRERHRLRARMDRATRRAAAPPPRRTAPPVRPAANTGGLGPGSWQYWPVALPATDETRR